MQVNEALHIQILRNDYEVKRKRNAAFSMRSYAKFLDIEASSLLSILKGKRKIPKTKVESIAERLSLTTKQKKLFVQSNLNEAGVAATANLSASEEKFLLKEEAHFTVVAEWEHYAILSLLEVKDFKPDVKWMAARLGLDVGRAQHCLNNLFTADLIKKNGTKLELTHKSGVFTDGDLMQKAIYKSTIEDIEQALTKFPEVARDARDFSSGTMTVNGKDMPELKKMIRDFRKKLISFAEFEEGEEVYKLNIQFFPVTELKEVKSIKTNPNNKEKSND
jgi:uncharacterized protein (TIGR02147 family)